MPDSARGARASVDTVLTWLLAAALLLAVAGVVYVAATPSETTEPFTEFYVLGPDGTASDYPTSLAVGETGTVVVGVSNHEHRPVTYAVGVVVNGTVVSERTLTVPDGATVERDVSYRPTTPGPKRVQLLLYRGTTVDLDREPYRRLWLLVNVSTG